MNVVIANPQLKHTTPAQGVKYYHTLSNEGFSILFKPSFISEANARSSSNLFGFFQRLSTVNRYLDTESHQEISKMFRDIHYEYEKSFSLYRQEILSNYLLILLFKVKAIFCETDCEC